MGNELQSTKVSDVDDDVALFEVKVGMSPPIDDGVRKNSVTFVPSDSRSFLDTISPSFPNITSSTSCIDLLLLQLLLQMIDACPSPPPTDSSTTTISSPTTTSPSSSPLLLVPSTTRSNASLTTRSRNRRRSDLRNGTSFRPPIVDDPTLWNM